MVCVSMISFFFTTKMVAEFYGVDERTIKRYVQEHGDELRANGYFLSEDNSLKEIRLHFDGDINVPNKVRKLGIFPFRAFLNIGMLLTESEKAKQLRARILDIVIATISGRARGGTKYINWRDRDYLPTAIKSENYRKNFTQAVGKFVDGHTNYKYEQITDLIYKAKQVIVVPGNHELYKQFDINKLHEGWTLEICSNVNAYYNSVIHLDEETDLIASTLWAKIPPAEEYLTERCVSNFIRIRNGKFWLSSRRFNEEHERC